MSNKLSILQNFRASDVRTEPFVHFTIDQALPAHLYEELSQAYPSTDTIFAHSFRKKAREMAQNARYDLSAAEILDMPELPIGPWHDFVHYHTSQEFLDEVLDKLGEPIARTHPDFVAAMARKAPNGTPRAGVRRRGDGPGRCELALDCQIGINSPVTVEGTSVIGPHLDNPRELCAGLFYLRHPDDRAAGGDLVTYRWKDRRHAKFHDKRHIDGSLVETCGTIPYGHNRFFWFLNSADAVHGVTVRAPSPVPRRLVNIIAEVYPTVPALFDITPFQRNANIFRKIRRALGR